jgi:hypothetical protein
MGRVSWRVMPSKASLATMFSSSYKVLGDELIRTPELSP